MPKLYLSPSTQDWNPYVTGSGSEEYHMNLLADALEPYLVSNAITWVRNTPDMTAGSSIRQANSIGGFDFYLALHSNASGQGSEGANRGIIAFYYPTSTRGQQAAEIFAARLREAKVTISEAGTKELRELAEAVRQSVVLALEIFESEDFSKLPEAQKQEYRIDEMQERFIQNHIDRLMSTTCDPLGGVIFTDMCNDLERCADQAIKVAYALYDENAHQKKHILP